MSSVQRVAVWIGGIVVYGFVGRWVILLLMPLLPLKPLNCIKVKEGHFFPKLTKFLAVSAMGLSKRRSILRTTALIQRNQRIGVCVTQADFRRLEPLAGIEAVVTAKVVDNDMVFHNRLHNDRWKMLAM